MMLTSHHYVYGVVERSKPKLDNDETVTEYRNQSRQAHLPALPDELERARFDILLSYWTREADAIREEITAEESSQRAVLSEYERELGPLRRDIEDLTGQIAQLESRLDRLEVADRPMTDTELDEEEQEERAETAAFWAEWRHQREEAWNGPTNARARPRNNGHGRGANHQATALRRLYRTLARLIHPDLASGEASRAHREAVMRLANEAFEAGDHEQLNRLLTIWSEPEGAVERRDVETIRAQVEKRRLEVDDLRRQLKDLKRSEAGKLVRSSNQSRSRQLKREQEQLRRELANLRLRRRRLMRTLEARRREFFEISD